MTVYEIVRAKIKDVAITEPDIQLAVDEVEEVIKNYCSIDEVPEGLKYTWANMSVDLVRYQYESNISTDDVLAGIDASDVSNLKIGDTQIALQGNNSERGKTLKSHRPNLDQIVMNNKQQLNKFRRMVW
ncbi:MAG: hypothetical protein WC961_08080 [Anaerovoracaceae bacterium]